MKIDDSDFKRCKRDTPHKDLNELFMGRYDDEAPPFITTLQEKLSISNVRNLQDQLDDLGIRRLKTLEDDGGTRHAFFTDGHIVMTLEYVDPSNPDKENIWACIGEQLQPLYQEDFGTIRLTLTPYVTPCDDKYFEEHENALVARIKSKGFDIHNADMAAHNLGVLYDGKPIVIDPGMILHPDHPEHAKEMTLEAFWAEGNRIGPNGEKPDDMDSYVYAQHVHTRELGLKYGEWPEQFITYDRLEEQLNKCFSKLPPSSPIRSGQAPAYTALIENHGAYRDEAATICKKAGANHSRSLKNSKNPPDPDSKRKGFCHFIREEGQRFAKTKGVGY